MGNSDPGRVWFDAVLIPHRSLSPRGFFLVMLALGSASFAAGVLFVLKGAWPVIGFFGLDVALVYFAFRANYRSGKNRETIRLTDRALEIARVSPCGQTSRLALEPSWVRIALSEFPSGDCRLSLRSSGREIRIAELLSAPERRSLAQALKEALFRRAQGFSLA
jgi:uncharacterized membrane protein